MEERDHPPPHVAPRVTRRTGVGDWSRRTSGKLRGSWGILGARRGWCVGHVEEALVLLVHLCHQLEQLCLTFVCRLCQLCLTLVHPLCQECFTRAGRVEFSLQRLDETL